MFFFKMGYDRRSLLTERCFHFPLMITMCSGYTLCIFTLFVFSLVHVRTSSPAGRQDIVMLSDGQIRSCYSALHQRRTRIVWQWSSMCSTVTLRVHQRWLTLSLKQSHYKVDMTSVTAAIITGQDSWPLAVTAHAAIRRNTARRLAAEPTEQKLFHNAASIVSDSEDFFSRCTLAGVFSFIRNLKSDGRVFRALVCNFSVSPLVGSHKKNVQTSLCFIRCSNIWFLVTYETISTSLHDQINPRLYL